MHKHVDCSYLSFDLRTLEPKLRKMPLNLSVYLSGTHFESCGTAMLETIATEIHVKN